MYNSNMIKSKYFIGPITHPSFHSNIQRLWTSSAKFISSFNNKGSITSIYSPELSKKKNWIHERQMWSRRAAEKRREERERGGADRSMRWGRAATGVVKVGTGCTSAVSGRREWWLVAIHRWWWPERERIGGGRKRGREYEAATASYKQRMR